jgi:hypothetical protein
MFESSLLKNIDLLFDEIVSLKVKFDNNQTSIDKEELIKKCLQLKSIDLSMVPEEFLENQEIIKIGLNNDIDIKSYTILDED